MSLRLLRDSTVGLSPSSLAARRARRVRCYDFASGPVSAAPLTTALLRPRHNSLSKSESFRPARANPRALRPRETSCATPEVESVLSLLRSGRARALAARAARTARLNSENFKRVRAE